MQPTILKQTDQNAPLPMFDMFMQSQRTLITSRRVMNQAIVDGVWKGYNRAVPANPDSYFSDHLKVEVQPRQRADQDIGAGHRPRHRGRSGHRRCEFVSGPLQRAGKIHQPAAAQQPGGRPSCVTQSQITALNKTIDEMATEFGSGTDLSFFYDSLPHAGGKAQCGD